jgi:hypothetical protein
MIGPRDILAIDDTVFPRKDTDSACVARRASDTVAGIIANRINLGTLELMDNNPGKIIGN